MSTTDTDLRFVILSLEVLADVAAEALAPLDGFCLADDQKDGNPPDSLPPRTTTPSLLRARIIQEVRNRLGEEAWREAERIIVDRDPKNPSRVRVMLPEQPGPRTDRLFVPLTAEAFGWWLSGRKRWEVRRDAKRWGPRHVRDGRRVELRLGYSGKSLWGTVGRVVRGGFHRLLMDNLIRPSDVVPEPAVVVREGAMGPTYLGPGRLIPRIENAIGLRQGEPDDVVAFKVKLDPGQGVTR